MGKSPPFQIGGGTACWSFQAVRARRAPQRETNSRRKRTVHFRQRSRKLPRLQRNTPNCERVQSRRKAPQLSCSSAKVMPRLSSSMPQHVQQAEEQQLDRERHKPNSACRCGSLKGRRCLEAWERMRYHEMCRCMNVWQRRTACSCQRCSALQDELREKLPYTARRRQYHGPENDAGAATCALACIGEPFSHRAPTVTASNAAILRTDAADATNPPRVHDIHTSSRRSAEIRMVCIVSSEEVVGNLNDAADPPVDEVCTSVFAISHQE